MFVTGLGAVSAFGVGAGVLWEACKLGEARIEPIPLAWDHYYRPVSRVWSPLPQLDFRALGFSKSDLLTTSMPSLIGICASQEALTDAQLFPRSPDRPKLPAKRTGIFLGTGLGGARAPFDNYRAHLLGGLAPQLKALLAQHPSDELLREHLSALERHPRVSPLVIPQSMPNAAAASISIRFGIQGPVETMCHACAAGTMAIGRAFKAIQRGDLDVAIAGGVEHLSDGAGGVFMGFDRLQTLARPRGSEIGSENRPFDVERTGFLFSEGGAAIVVLESESFARQRTTRPLAELRGFATSSDAQSMLAISEENNAIDEMLEEVLLDANLSSKDIGYINAHGTSTELNDRIESRIIEKHFAHGPAVNSTKSILGHTIGASGALEAIVTTKSLMEQRVHRSRNLERPIAPLNFCLESMEVNFEFALSQSFGFGGHNAALIFARVDPP
ncbi:MAG: beta-ketoacyl synthase [Gammaproteobacteria bacterium]